MHEVSLPPHPHQALLNISPLDEKSQRPREVQVVSRARMHTQVFSLLHPAQPRGKALREGHGTPLGEEEVARQREAGRAFLVERVA